MIEEGIDSETIDAVLNYKPIRDEMFLRLSVAREVTVRHMLGRNANLTEEQRKVLLRDPDAYARGGVAMNPNVSEAEIGVLKRDPARNVLQGLAMDPFVPEDTLLALWREHHLPLSTFAANPRCPAEIMEEIGRNGSSFDRKVFAIGKEEKRKGVYLGKSLPPEESGDPLQQ